MMTRRSMLRNSLVGAVAMAQSSVRWIDPLDCWIDRDRDHIPDWIEEDLLRRCRPYYKFSRKDGSGELYRPSDAVWQLRYAQLRTGDWLDIGSEPSVVKVCGAVPDYFVDPPERLLYCTGGDTNLMRNTAKSGYYLKINALKRHGLDWDFVVKNAPGLYGHVVPHSGHTGCYRIEYWQYFGYNGVDIYGGDHEGDWCTVQLCYDYTTKKLLKTSHYVHGRDPMCFDLTQTVRRLHVTIDHADMIECRGSNYIKPAFPADQLGPPESYQNHTVRFYVDHEGNEHVVVYIERNCHEFWPTEYGSFTFANEHNGKGPSYLTAYDPAKPLNLGEVEHPLSQDARLILWFNGFWGCFHQVANSPPPGPALHTEWHWPEGSALHQAIRADDFEGASNPGAGGGH